MKAEYRKSHQRKKDQLGMPIGTAASRLRKMIMFDFSKRLKLDNCYRCKQKIQSIDEFTIDHKLDWMDEDPNLFWDLDNIAFSHSKCNRPRPPKPRNIHGTPSTYYHGCRCDKCKKWKSDKNRKTRARRLIKNLACED